MQLNDLPDPPCTPVRNLRSSFFTPSPYNSLLPPSFKCLPLALLLPLNVFSVLVHISFLPSLLPLLVKQLHQLRVHAPSGEGSSRAWSPDKNMRKKHFLLSSCHITSVSIQQ